MSLAGLSLKEIEALIPEFMQHIPKDGSLVGNKQLRDLKLKWDEAKYLSVRRHLVAEGKLALGQGRGGSVRLISPQENAPIKNGVNNSISDPYVNEDALYEPFLNVIRDRWVNEKSFEYSIVENTSKGGGRKDGKWSRPDITVAAKIQYMFVPGKFLDIVTFEVKHFDGVNLTSVYEALAHRRSANSAYVLIYIPEHLSNKFKSEIEEIEEEAAKHGIGLIIASDPTNFDNWDIRVEAERTTPDPFRVDSFIRAQLSERTREQILRWFK